MHLVIIGGSDGGISAGLRARELDPPSTQPSAARALAARTFLSWAADPAKGNSSDYLSKVDFVPLPSVVRPGLQALIASIGT